MTRLLLITAGVLVTASAASAQDPTQPYPLLPTVPPQNVMGNIFNPRTQPLSPYLNLLRNGNTATNYYFGVRPATVGGGSFGALGAPFTAAGTPRAPFFPQQADPDLFPPSTLTGSPTDLLPPAGHPVVFNNTLGYYPSPFGNRGGVRPGLAGVGATRPPAPKK